MSTTVYLYDNVLLDKEYRNISNIRISNSTRTPVKSYTGLTFQRVESEIINSGSPRLAGTIRLPLNNDLEVLRKCGYMTFQNSGDIKYYAFIDEVNYINAGNVEIKYTIDDFQTYLTGYLNTWVDMCYVEQEHIDREYDKPISLDGSTQNLTPSNLIWNPDNYYQFTPNETPYIGLVCLYDKALKEEFEKNGFIVTLMNGGRSSLMLITKDGYFGYDSAEKIGEILSNAERYKYVVDCVSSTYPIRTTKSTRTIETDFELYPESVDGYEIKNKILCTFPFMQFFIKSTTGESIKIHPRDCEREPGGTLNVKLTTPGYLSKNAIVSVSPESVYNSKKRPSTNKCVKFPIAATIPVQRDQLLNFLSTTAATTATSMIGSIGSIIGGGLMISSGAGAAVGVPMIIGGAAGGLGSLASAGLKVNNVIEPTGNFENDIYSIYTGMHGFEIITYSPSKEEVEMLDNYFGIYGYITNRVKVPNIKNRNKFNYLKCRDVGSWDNVPPRAKTAMENAFAKGVFIWHDLEAIGNFDLKSNG